MKHFTFRLFLIRKLIESLAWSCIDEYTEFEEIADGLGRTLWAIERKRIGIKHVPNMQEHYHNATTSGSLPSGGYQPISTGYSHSVTPPTGGSGTKKE